MIDHLLGRPSPSWKRAQVSVAPSFYAGYSDVLIILASP